MKFEIVSRWSGAVLFSVETETLKLAVELGVKSGANLYEANLGDSKFPIQILGHKHFMQTTADGKLQIGCHIHTLEQWKKNAEKIGAAENYSHLDIEIYKLHIAHIIKVSQLLWNAEKAKP